MRHADAALLAHRKCAHQSKIYHPTITVISDKKMKKRKEALQHRGAQGKRSI
jgi:hypothetical protein